MFIADFYSIDSKQITERGFVTNIQLDPKHFVYKAHFPDNPITPGVCILEIAKQLLSKYYNKELRLITIKNLKFLHVLIPSSTEKVSFKFDISKNENNKIEVKIVVENKTTCFTKINCILSNDTMIQ